MDMLAYSKTSLPLATFQGAVVKHLPANTEDSRDAGLIHELGRSPLVKHSNPLQYSCLGNSMDRGAWQATVLGVSKSLTQLSY